MGVIQGNVRSGEPLRIAAATFNAILDVTRKAQPGGGASARAVRFRANSPQVLAIPCVTTGAPTDGVYPVNLHADGKNAAGTGTGELELLSVHIGEELPTGTWVLAFPATVIVTGGS